VVVVDFTAGMGAGFGQDLLPGVVLGPPQGGGESHQGLDVLSLGKGGTITLEMGLGIANGPGADFIVFENAFLAEGSEQIFSEPAEVSVSEDGVEFVPFVCAAENEAPNGCAGNAPVYANPKNDLDPTNPEEAGGDAFDLDAIGMERARFIRLRDRSLGQPIAPSAGFDLDAVAVVHGESTEN
jgi:hypothetical protein